MYFTKLWGINIMKKYMLLGVASVVLLGCNDLLNDTKIPADFEFSQLQKQKIGTCRNQLTKRERKLPSSLKRTKAQKMGACECVAYQFVKLDNTQYFKAGMDGSNALIYQSKDKNDMSFFMDPFPVKYKLTKEEKSSLFNKVARASKMCSLYSTEEQDRYYSERNKK